jgi:hypothetical protein
MKSRTIAIAGSIAALAFAAAPIAAVAATAHPGGTSTTRVDASRDMRGARHIDRTPDKRSADRSVDVRDR